jgi:hypothetical protein
MNSKPLVSILINNYNYARFLSQAIDSALTQTYGKVEVVVVDDGSTDASRDVISRYRNNILPVVKENGGQASAYNAGFAASSGEIICLLDSDDLFLPHKVGRIVELYESNPEIGWCFDIIREFDNETGEHQVSPVSPPAGKWDARQRTAAGKPPVLWTTSSGLSFLRKTLAQILPMPEQIRITSDNYIKWMALALEEGWLTSEILSLQRIHGNNAYTKRRIGKKRLTGRTQLLTGIFLHDKSPNLELLAKKIFSRGLGILWASGGVDPDCRQLTRRFLRQLDFPKRSEILLRAACWTALQAHSR